MKYLQGWRHWCIDVLALSAIIAVGWFLIGYYTHFEYLKTGYQDWIYHAFRVKSLTLHGITSWDHLWSNGLNHWRSYQYLFHLVILATTKLFSLSIPRAMMWWVVIVFIALRVGIYLILRHFKVAPLAALFVTVISFVYVQQWITIKDFSLHVALIFIPLFVFLWIKSYFHPSVLYVATAVAGFSWMVHPILGYSLTGLLGMRFLFSSPKLTWKQWVSFSVLFLLSSSSFTIPYILTGYSYSNPFLSSSQFVRSTLTGDHYGLSLMYVLLLGLSWLAMLLKTAEIPRWAKVLLLYCSLYFLVIILGRAGYMPSFLLKLQISRAITLIALLLPFAFGAIIHPFVSGTHNRFVTTLLTVLIAVNLVKAVEIASQFTGTPINDIDNPVASFFADKHPTGSIFYYDVSEASYFARDGLRYVTSYNEHLEPHPLAQSFKRLMKSDIAYTGVSAQQQALIRDYALVLGIEYIFAPAYSPLVSDLAAATSSAQFVEVGQVQGSSGSYSILQAKYPVRNAYIGDKNELEQKIAFEPIAKPTLNSLSFKPWDDEVQKLASLIRDGTLQPVPLEFGETDKLRITLPSENLDNKALLITQSYDPNWEISGYSEAELQPIALRFMFLPLNNGTSGKQLVLVNSWPSWYWPVQMAGPLTLDMSVAGYSLFVAHKVWKKRRHHKNNHPEHPAIETLHETS